jgi:hypothetical protein
MAAVRGEKVTEQIAVEKEHLTYCEFDCYSESHSVTARSLHEHNSTFCKKPKRKIYVICSLALLRYNSRCQQNDRKVIGGNKIYSTPQIQPA